MLQYKCLPQFEANPDAINRAWCVKHGDWMGPNLTCSSMVEFSTFILCFIAFSDELGRNKSLCGHRAQFSKNCTDMAHKGIRARTLYRRLLFLSFLCPSIKNTCIYFFIYPFFF